MGCAQAGPSKPKECPEKNYLRTVNSPKEGMLLVRQTFGRRDKETPAKVSTRVPLFRNVGKARDCETLYV